MSRSLKAGVLMAVVLGWASWARAETIAVPMPDGEALLHFDPRIIAEDRLLELALVSPYVTWTFAGPAEACMEAEAGAPECVSEPLDAASLLEAEAELEYVDEMLEDVRRLEVPPLLEKALKYVRREAALHLCLRRSELAYYRGDDYALWAPCDDIVPIDRCSEEMAQAPLAHTPEARYRLAGAWRGCMTARFHARHGYYPHDDWEAFLAEQQIEADVPHGC